jgi:hypothetical protein
MATLVIKDLVLNEELDRNAMINVRGGMLHLTAPVRLPAPVHTPSRNIVTTIEQLLSALASI